MADTITVSMTFDKPASDQELAETLSGLIGALPRGRPGARLKLKVEGAPAEFAAAFETAFALGRAQLAARRSRPEG